jgi:hypothetical protein
MEKNELTLYLISRAGFYLVNASLIFIFISVATGLAYDSEMSMVLVGLGLLAVMFGAITGIMLNIVVSFMLWKHKIEPSDRLKENLLFHYYNPDKEIHR